MNAITVCVDFDDILAVTLPRNAKHFEQITVITAPHDAHTTMVANETPNAQVFVTNAFYTHGAKFNKGLAIEQGLDILGREGWLATLDVDIVLPPALTIDGPLDKTCLYGARRRMLLDPSDYHGQADWTDYPLAPDGEIPGCFQLFHADAPALTEKPWFGTDWTHAGGYDSVFEAKFRPDNTRWLPFEILHLGIDGANWYGRVSPRLDDAPTRNQKQHLRNMQEMRRVRDKTQSMDHERLGQPCRQHPPTHS